MGNIASFSQSNAQPKYHINFKIFEPYFQDDYHISKNLTLNLGVRISLYGTFWERNHLISNWFPSAYDPTTAPRLQVNDTPDIPQGAIIPGSGDPFDGTVQCGVNGIPRGCLKGHLFNPAPRLGFSWDPLGMARWRSAADMESSSSTPTAWKLTPRTSRARRPSLKPLPNTTSAAMPTSAGRACSSLSIDDFDSRSRRVALRAAVAS